MAPIRRSEAHTYSTQLFISFTCASPWPSEGAPSCHRGGKPKCKGLCFNRDTETKVDLALGCLSSLPRGPLQSRGEPGYSIERPDAPLARERREGRGPAVFSGSALDRRIALQ